MIAFDPNPAPKFSVAARTDPGKKRTHNEDALFAADPCFIVADGMGGHDHGDAASKAAISAFSEAFTAPGEATIERIERAIQSARVRVRAIAADSERGAGCTLSGAIRITHNGVAHWFVLNIGDSRVYLQRGQKLIQLTKDHSLRSELIEEGDANGVNVPRNVITRALGSSDDRHDAWLLPIETGSRLLVCTDGLTGELSDEALRGLLVAGGRTDSVVDELMSRALESGGRDNVSVILVDVQSGGVPATSLEDDAEGDTLEITRPGVR